MKTIILIRNAAPYDFGGGERFPIFLAETIQTNNYAPLVASRSKKLLDFAKSSSVPTVRGWWWSHQNWSGKFALLFPVYFIWQIALFFYYLQLFIRINPQAIHIQSKDDFIAATFAGKLLRKRIIWTDHADLKHIWRNVRVWYKNPVGKLVRFAARFADAITVVSESERILVGDGIGRKSELLDKITVVYNGVVEKKVAVTKHSDALVSFCMANRLVRDKGIGEAIEAFIRLEKEHPNSELLLMGDGPEADTFKTLAKSHEKIRFLGHQSDPLHYIANADVFVQPTYHEGFSVALVEASMLARPIIATAVGGNVEIIQDGVTGLLVPPKNVDELYLAMKKLLDGAGLRDKLGTNARKQYEERFNFAHITRNQFIPLYEGGK